MQTIFLQQVSILCSVPDIYCTLDTTKDSVFTIKFQFMSPLYHFTAAPLLGSADQFTALVYGDMGVSPVPRAYETADYAMREAETGTAALVIHNGDISYARGYVS